MNSTLQALGWTLIHFCWQATVIAALYLTADLWLKKARSQTRYLVALATLSSMFIAFVGTLGYETWRSSVASPLPFSNVLTRPVVNVPINTFTTQIEVLANGSITLHLANLLPWLDGVWMLGVLGLSMRSLGGWLWLQRLRQTTMEKAPEAIQASFQKVCDRLGIRRLPELRISEIIPGPMTIGFLRTLVLLPASTLLALSPEQLEAIFAHELAHVRRADYFWNLVQTLAETLFFFHPAVWWLGKRLREQRELCCDDVAIATCPDPLVYATALFRLEDQRATGQSLAMGIGGDPTMQLLPRIARILGAPFHSTRELRSALVLKLSVLVLASIAVLCGTAAVSFFSLSTSSRTQTIAASNPPQYNVPAQESQRASSRAGRIADDIARREAPIIARRQASSTPASGFTRNAQALSEQAAAAAVSKQQSLSPQQDGDPDAPDHSNVHPDVTPQSLAP